MAVIDVDGDGDIDIVNTNADGDNMSLLKNDGTGKFPTSQTGTDGGPGIIFFDSAFGMGTASQEFGLMSGDMNEDGILDIVIGAAASWRRGAQTVVNGYGQWHVRVRIAASSDDERLAAVRGRYERRWSRRRRHRGCRPVDTLSLTPSPFFSVTAKARSPRNRPTAALKPPFASHMGDIDGDKDLGPRGTNFSGNWQVFVERRHE